MKKIKFAGFMVASFFVVSVSLGAAWTSKRLTFTAGETYNPVAAVDGTNVYAVWEDETSGISDIFFKKSSDSGATWAAAKQLTYTSGVTASPDIAVDGSDIHVVWLDTTPGNREVYYKKSIDGGSTWQAAKRITNNTGGSVCPKIAVDGSKIYIVWYDSTPGNIEIFFVRSIDGGATWKTAHRLTNNAGGSYWPVIAVAGSNIYVAWYDDTPGNSEIFFRKSTDGGATWQSSKKLTNNSGESSYPAIGVYGSRIYVVWMDDTPGNNEIYLRKSADGGGTWQTAKKLSNNAGDSEDPDISVIGSQIHVTWDDYTPGNWDIYFRQSGDGGTNWNAVQNITNNAAGSAWPRIAATAAKIFIVYTDDTPGNSEVFLKISI